MSEASIPRRDDHRHGEHVEEDEPTLDQPGDSSDPSKERPQPDPASAPARPTSSS